MAVPRQLSFGIKTTPMHTTYDDILTVWREADALPVIEHAWLWDHMLPLAGDPAGPIHEGWTLLAALAAQTERLRLGLMVTSNLIRPPAVLAKIAATTDVISGGRLEFGVGVGNTEQTHVDPDAAAFAERATREFAAYGLTMVAPGEGVTRLAEACTIVKRMWTEDVFDFEGRYYQLKGAICEPKPVQDPHPPVLIGGMGDRTLRVVAEHSDIWNVPGPPHSTVDWIVERNRVLDAHCAAIGRDPAEIIRSVQLIVSREQIENVREAIRRLTAVGVTHFVLAPLPPFAPGVAHWLAEEIVEPAFAASGKP